MSIRKRIDTLLSKLEKDFDTHNSIEATVGDEVIVYSNNPSHKNAVDNIAIANNLFNYNLLTALSHDVRRMLVD